MRDALYAVIAVVLTGSGLSAQPQTSRAPVTLINDSAWSASASILDLTQVRAADARARLANVSVRGKAGTGEATLIAGAVVNGAQALPMMVRAVGPGLGSQGVVSPLAQPDLAVFRDTSLMARTNTYAMAATSAAAYVGAFPAITSPEGVAAGDAGLIGKVTPGIFTAHCTPADGAPGVALLEFYDASTASEVSARFVNLSGRARVEEGEGLLIAGFVVAGRGEITVLLRGVGRSLEQVGVSATLADPVIDLYAGQTRIATNDNWQADPDAARRISAAQATTNAMPLTSAADAAMVVTLKAGAYTLHVRGASAQTGVALAEVYEVAKGAFDAAEATNATGLDLFRKVAASKPGETLVVSPYSVESALALAYAGAAGETRAEMARVLHLPDSNAELQTGFTNLRDGIAEAAAASRVAAAARSSSYGGQTEPIIWSEANRLFGQRDYGFRESFLALMQDGFAAPLQTLDFIDPTERERSRITINDWVEEQTRDKIKDLIQSGTLTVETRLVLVNALYLKAAWDTPFNVSSTENRPFRYASGEARDVPTMKRVEYLDYAAETGRQIAALNYLGNGLKFVIVLPNEDRTVDDVVAELTTSDFTRWAKLGDGNRTYVDLLLPKFRAEGQTLPLGDTFKALGLRQAFDEPRGSANFDGIAPRRPDDYLWLSDVVHKTFVAIDEKGTEAAAATAVIIGGTTSYVPPPIPVEMHVDRPFLFAILHRDTGLCLFLGRVMAP